MRSGTILLIFTRSGIVTTSISVLSTPAPGPNAMSPYFEMGFARLKYTGSIGGQSRFDLAYMRHTGRWWEIMHGLTLEQCLAEIREGGLFDP